MKHEHLGISTAVDCSASEGSIGQKRSRWGHWRKSVSSTYQVSILLKIPTETQQCNNKIFNSQNYSFLGKTDVAQHIYQVLRPCANCRTLTSFNAGTNHFEIKALISISRKLVSDLSTPVRSLAALDQCTNPIWEPRLVIEIRSLLLQNQSICNKLIRLY